MDCAENPLNVGNARSWLVHGLLGLWQECGGVCVCEGWEGRGERYWRPSGSSGIEQQHAFARKLLQLHPQASRRKGGGKE
jgi:hypothetical protein